MPRLVRSLNAQKRRCFPRGPTVLEIACSIVRRGEWKSFVLDDKPVSGITSSLVEAASLEGKPYRLYENSGRSFQGSNVLGTGFMLQEEEARELIHRDSRNKAVLFPFIGGEDINSRFDQSASRWIINFFDWPLSPETAPHGYEGPHASDYPDCLSIVETRVKPERDLLGLKEDASARGYAKHWWQYARKGIELYSTIRLCFRVANV